MSSPDVLIVGAGISGLSTAWWLAQQGISIEIWEADERPGGCALGMAGQFSRRGAAEPSDSAGVRLGAAAVARVQAGTLTPWEDARRFGRASAQSARGHRRSR